MLKRLITAIMLLTVVTLLVSCGPKAVQKEETSLPEASEKKTDTEDTKDATDEEQKKTPEVKTSSAQQRLKDMSVEEKIGQLFIVRPEALSENYSSAQVNDASDYGVTEMSESMSTRLSHYYVGGVVMFSKNIASPTQITAFIDSLQKQSKTPLFIGVDEEGGTVARVARAKGFSVKKYISMEKVGATGDSSNAKSVGVTIGTYLKQYGFNLDFAPVADVNTNPQNIVIGNRSFGSDPDLVAEMVSAEIGGLHQAGVMSCVKHFPGHGDTKGDTHEGFVSVEKTWAELENCELIPFKKAITAPTDMVMAAHINVPNITSDGLPTSLSKEMITDKLRGQLQYDGVVITDSLSMGAITDGYSSSEAAVRAISAGADILLMPDNFTQAYEGVYQAVQDGVISESRLDESVLRILTLKEKYGLLS